MARAEAPHQRAVSSPTIAHHARGPACPTPPQNNDTRAKRAGLSPRGVTSHRNLAQDFSFYRITVKFWHVFANLNLGMINAVKMRYSFILPLWVVRRNIYTRPLETGKSTESRRKEQLALGQIGPNSNTKVRIGDRHDMANR